MKMRDKVQQEMIEMVQATSSLLHLDKEVSDADIVFLPFQFGDEVNLKSGGPSMTVVGYDIDTKDAIPVLIVSCLWFVEGDGKLHSALFPEFALKKA